MPAPLGEGREGATISSACEGGGGVSTSPSWIPEGRSQWGDGDGAVVDPNIGNLKKERQGSPGQLGAAGWPVEEHQARWGGRWKSAAGRAFPIVRERGRVSGRRDRWWSMQPNCFAPLELTQAAQRRFAGHFRGAGQRRSGLSRAAYNLNS
jgi:hypothetical protein